MIRMHIIDVHITASTRSQCGGGGNPSQRAVRAHRPKTSWPHSPVWPNSCGPLRYGRNPPTIVCRVSGGVIAIGPNQCAGCINKLIPGCTHQEIRRPCYDAIVMLSIIASATDSTVIIERVRGPSRAVDLREISMKIVQACRLHPISPGPTGRRSKGAVLYCAQDRCSSAR